MHACEYVHVYACVCVCACVLVMCRKHEYNVCVHTCACMCVCMHVCDTLKKYIFFNILYSKKLYEQVHYFIHLNLALALFLGYVTFAAGITTATENRVRIKILEDILLNNLSKYCKSYFLKSQ